MDTLLATALEAAEAASEIHLRYFGSVGVEEAREKGKSDFVTQVDLEAQEAAIGVIHRRFPHHQILAEEGEEASARSWPDDGTPLWIIDPLDGTTNFLHRHPMFGASVAVGCLASPAPEEAKGAEGILEAGAVVAPTTGERWWAQRGHGAFKDGRPIKVSGLRTLRNALVGTGFPFKEPELVPRYLEQFSRVLPASGGIRRCGSAALDLCYLAEGILDAFWEEDYLSPWDVAGGLIILREAGGVGTRLDGSEIGLADGSVIAANSPELMEELGVLIRGG